MIFERFLARIPRLRKWPCRHGTQTMQPSRVRKLLMDDRRLCWHRQPCPRRHLGQGRRRGGGARAAILERQRHPFDPNLWTCRVLALAVNIAPLHVASSAPRQGVYDNARAYRFRGLVEVRGHRQAVQALDGNLIYKGPSSGPHRLPMTLKGTRVSLETARARARPSAFPAWLIRLTAMAGPWNLYAPIHPRRWRSEA